MMGAGAAHEQLLRVYKLLSHLTVRPLHVNSPPQPKSTHISSSPATQPKLWFLPRLALPRHTLLDDWLTRDSGAHGPGGPGGDGGCGRGGCGGCGGGCGPGGAGGGMGGGGGATSSLKRLGEKKRDKPQDCFHQRAAR